MKLKQLHQLTELLGLTLNESQIYTFLLKVKQASGTKVIAAADLDKSSGYRALNSLIEKNLVYSVGQERNRLFVANPYQEIIKLADSKIAQIDTAKNQLETIFQSLDEYAKQEYQKNITVYEGKDGYKRFLESRLVPKTTIREIGSRQNIETFFNSPQDYEQYMTSNYIPKRLANKSFLKGLMPLHDKYDHVEKSDSSKLKEVHVLPKNFQINALLTSWEDYTGFYSQEKGTIICVSIKDRLVTQIFNQMFDLIWDISEDSL